MFKGNNSMNGNWFALRWQVLQRDNFTCQYCGQSAPSVILHVDHKTPRAVGGVDDMDNLVAACGACNIGRNLDHFVVPRGSNKHRVSLYDHIVAYLTVNGEATATELGRELNRQKSRANIASLLSNDDSFTVARKEGRSVYYRLAD